MQHDALTLSAALGLPFVTFEPSHVRFDGIGRTTITPAGAGDPAAVDVSRHAEYGGFMAWLTLSYASDGASVIGLGRYIGQDEGGTFKNGYDLGGRLLYAWDRWGVSVEFVNRHIDVSEQRYAGSLEFRVAGDTWVTTTFGKDYGRKDTGDLLASVNQLFGATEKTFGHASYNTGALAGLT